MSDDEQGRAPMEIVREIDRVEYRLTSYGTRLQWELTTPILNDLYAELEEANRRHGLVAEEKVR